MQMKNIRLTNPFKCLKARDYAIWTISVVINFIAFAVTGFKDALTFVSAVVGVTCLIFNAKGHVISQILGVIFAIFYSVVSYFLHYYSEFITYAFMSGPLALLSIVSWLKNPYGKSGQVSIAKLTKFKIIVMFALTAAVTTAFYFILRALDTPNLAVSTVSIATSFLACFLMLVRSPWFAVAYAANDIVLIVLWVLATIKDAAYLPMVTCFAIFLFNDIYTFISWCAMKRKQSEGEPIEETACDNDADSDQVQHDAGSENL